MKKISILSLLLLISVSTLFAATSKTITIENQLDDSVYYLYLTPVDVKDWGSDRLGDETLDPGATIEVEISVDESQPLYNLMAEDEAEKTYRIANINLQEVSSITINDSNLYPFGGLNPVMKKIKFTNQTGEDIYYLYISSTDSMYWGEDLLGDEILDKDKTITLEIPVDEESPVNDIRAEGENGSSYEITEQNMMEVTEFTFTDQERTSTGDEISDTSDYNSNAYNTGNDDYLDGYRDGFKDAWKEAYKLGFQDAQNQ